ncbi:DUF3817 domain-containing protein [Microbacterium rhizomatis]|uniref:DUF3817 domain-containing protein n=1 Tax=Microbacterium rhizomatis TaxID=1631477 RepID=A0A5J5IZ86_9MICO|nr:DUF3817 domain-containing protein [Microbacterium rhizomatis]KAA9105600.1 DUF3817 domain-containing protein [Microbacterium rhizomatis]
MFRSPLFLFRTLAIAEAISWTLLIGGLILRATSGLAIAVTIGGGIHGFIFLAYGATAVLVAKNQRWDARSTAVAIVSTLIPYATIPVEMWLHRTRRLVGSWRLEATADPRDAAWHDRLMRWFLRRPWMLGAIVALVLVAIFVVLLVIGPPGR